MAIIAGTGLSRHRAASGAKAAVAEFSSYTGLPWRIDEVSLDIMLATLLAAREEACSCRQHGEPA